MREGEAASRPIGDRLEGPPGAPGGTLGPPSGPEAGSVAAGAAAKSGKRPGVPCGGQDEMKPNEAEDAKRRSRRRAGSGTVYNGPPGPRPRSPERSGRAEGIHFRDRSRKADEEIEPAPPPCAVPPEEESAAPPEPVATMSLVARPGMYVSASLAPGACRGSFIHSMRVRCAPARREALRPRGGCGQKH